MDDFLYVGITLAFWLGMLGVLLACDRLMENKP